MTEITVNGMTCTSCATHVKDALEKIPGVNAAVVSYPESRAQVMADTAVSHNQLLAAIAALGYQGSIRLVISKMNQKSVMHLRAPVCISPSLAAAGPRWRRR